MNWLSFKYYDNSWDFAIDEWFDTLSDREIISTIEHAKDLWLLFWVIDIVFLENLSIDERQERVLYNITSNRIFSLLMLWDIPTWYWKGRQDNDKLYSEFTYVDQKYRNQWYWKLLKENQIEYAKQHGYKTLYSSTTQEPYDNQAAKNILESTWHQLFIQDGNIYWSLDITDNS